MEKLFLLLLALSSVGIVSAQNDVIVDNPQAIFEGTWDLAKAAKDRHGDDYRSTFCVEGAATATATFRPQLGISGKYNVEVMYPRGDNRTANAPWFISYDGGTVTTNISQRVSGTPWVRIGSGLSFNAGTAGFVRLSNNSGEEKETTVGKPVVIADAVRFVLVAKTATANAPESSPEKASTTSSKPGGSYAVQTFEKGRGKIRRTPDQPGYSAGDVIQLTAKADKGNVFAGWSGDVVGYDNPLKIKVGDNVAVTAEFLPEARGAILESTEAKFEGHWAQNTQKWPGQRSPAYRFALGSLEGNLTATFTPKLPKAGKYDIYIYYLQGENRATTTNWEIVSKSGSSIVSVNQRVNGSQWFQIAAATEFEAGSKGFVRVTSQADPIPCVVVADSVAFLYVGPPDGK